MFEVCIPGERHREIGADEKGDREYVVHKGQSKAMAILEPSLLLKPRPEISP